MQVEFNLEGVEVTMVGEVEDIDGARALVIESISVGGQPLPFTFVCAVLEKEGGKVLSSFYADYSDILGDTNIVGIHPTPEALAEMQLEQAVNDQH